MNLSKIDRFLKEKWRKLEDKNMVKMKSIILAFMVFEILVPLGGFVAYYGRQW